MPSPPPAVPPISPSGPPPHPPPPPRAASTVAIGKIDAVSPMGMVTGSASVAKAAKGSGKWDVQPGKARQPVPVPATEADVTKQLLADLDGDGIDDLIVLTHAPHPSYVYLNPGNGDFSGVSPKEIGKDGVGATDKGDSSSAAVADVNGDGIADIIVSNDGTFNMIYLGVPGPFPAKGDFSGVIGTPFGSANGPSRDVAVGDIDGDGAPDIAVANHGKPNVVYWGEPAAFSTQAAPQYAKLPADKPAAGTSGASPSGEWVWSTIGLHSDASTSIALGDMGAKCGLDILVGNEGGAPSRVFASPTANRNTPASGGGKCGTPPPAIPPPSGPPPPGLSPPQPAWRVTQGLPTAPASATISSSFHTTCVVLDSGEVKCWGDNTLGQLGGKVTENQTVFGNALMDKCLDPSCPCRNMGGYGGKCGQSEKIDATCSTKNFLSSCGAPDFILNTPRDDSFFNYQHARLQHGDMLMPDGRKRRSSSPVSVGLDPRAGGAVAVASGQYHSCAIVADGSVHCWGQNNHGQLGRGFSTPNIDLMSRNCPLFSWKYNGVESLASYYSDWQCPQILIGKTPSRIHLPAAPPSSRYRHSINVEEGPIHAPAATLKLSASGAKAVAIAAGSLHTCVILDDGTISCWGNNEHGVLGDGGATAEGAIRAVPGPTASLGVGRSAVQIAAGGYRTCAILDDGSIVCWGSRIWGAMGDGTCPCCSRAPAVPSPPPAFPLRTPSLSSTPHCSTTHRPCARHATQPPSGRLQGTVG